MRKSWVIALSLMLAGAVLLAGCNNSGGKSADASQSPAAGSTAPSSASAAPASASPENSNVTEPGTFPVVKDKIELTIFTQDDPTIENLETNEFTKEYEEKTNVHVNWMLVSNKDLEQKRNLLLAANSDLPDVFMNANINNVQQVQYGSQGVIIPLNDLIDKYAPNIQKLFEYDPSIKKMITAPDGNIYALPSVEETYHTRFGQKMWINQAWLDKLGLKMPETTDDLYNVLKAFKEKDPNGNGKADEIPMTGAITGYNTSVYHFIMSAFIQDDGFDQRPFILNDGKVSTAFDQPQWQEGLKFLNKLYKEELLDPGAITQDNNQLKQLGNNKDTTLIGSVTAGAMTGFMAAGTDRMKEYTSIPPLKGPQGVQTTGYYPYQINVGKFAITNANKNPEATMRWVDWFYTTEGTMRANAGREGTDWEYAKPGDIGLNGEKGTFHRLLLFGKTQNVHWNKNAPNFYPEAFRSGSVVDPNEQEAILYRETKEKYAPYQPKEVLPKLFMTEEEAEEYNSIDFNLLTYLKESTARFVVGNLDPDKDWDNYLKELDKIGLKRYVEMTQQAYDRQFK